MSKYMVNLKLKFYLQFLNIKLDLHLKTQAKVQYYKPVVQIQAADK